MPGILGNAFASGQAFAKIPQQDMGRLAERCAKERERRAKKRARAKAKKVAEKQGKAAEVARLRDAQEADRKARLAPVHESLRLWRRAGS